MIVDFEGKQHEFPEDATEDEIRSALSSAPPSPSTAEDIGASLKSGVRKGAVGLAGLPGDIAEYGARGINAAVQGVGNYFGLDVGPSRQAQAPTYGSADIGKKVEELAGPAYEPQTRAGRYAQTVGEFLPAALTGPGGIARRAVMGAAVPGVASEAAGEATQGTALEPYARIGAAVAAPSITQRAITPLAPRGGPARAAEVANLRGEGVELTAGQATGSRPLQYMESSLGDITGAGSRAVERGQEQFTRAILRRAGINAPRATADVIDDAFTRIGQQFDDLAARNTLVPDPGMGGQIRAVVNDYNSIVSPPMRAPAIANFEQEIAKALAANNGAIPGATYQSLRSRMEANARSIQRSSPEVADTLRDMRGALDAAMERHLQRIGSPDLGAWQETRRQYRNILPIERAATGPGADTATGLISPSQLRTAVVGQGRRAYARGQGDLAGLARSGEAVMRPLPQSGTAPRAYMSTALPASIGAIGTGLLAGSPAALGAGLLGALGPPIGGGILMSPAMQRYLQNQRLPRGPTNPLTLPLAIGSSGGLP
jgi:hypothetical protein